MRYRHAVGWLEALEPRRLLTAIPAPAHVVVVVEENHGYQEVIGNSAAPYLNSLAGQGALFSESFAVSHPSQPNYLALFSGSTQGVSDDNGPLSFKGPDLASLLQSAGRTFAGFSEGLPATGSTILQYSAYARKHNPWSDFSDVPSSENLPFSSFPQDYNLLPTVSFIVPNLNDDMHDGTVAQGDYWLQTHLSGYATWARTHNSLLIVTWDEDDSSQNNRIPTIFVGQPVKPGMYGETINHYSVLRTIEDMYHLPYVGASTGASSIQDVWQSSPALQLHAVPVGATEGQRFTSVVAAFTDADNNTLASRYSATITWGDGSTATAGTISWNSWTHQWQIAGIHRYRYAWSYHLSITLTDSDGSSAAVASTASMADAPLRGGGLSLILQSSALASVPQTLAVLTDANPFAESSTFSVSINWGDGTTGVGKVQWDWNRWAFDVLGKHQYAVKKSYTVAITIGDLVGGARATAQSTVTVT